MFDLTRKTPAGSSDSTRRDLPDLRVQGLNTRFRHHSANSILHHALSDMGKIALVSSFGAESVVLLHMAALVDQATPVVFIDSEMLFAETLV